MNFRLWWIVGLLVGCGTTMTLTERVAQFPNLGAQPSFSLETPDLYYPNWFEGRWRVTAVLEAVEAPQGVEFTNPTAFAQAQRHQGQSIPYTVRFYPNDQGQIIADRAFNTTAITQAYLGRDAVVEVQIDPSHPDHQTVLLSRDRRGELYITRRHSEQPNPAAFATLEFYRQVLASPRSVPLTKDIETTTLYRRQANKIEAIQMTAVYLVATDEKYFQSSGQAVTVYRYKLNFAPSR
jgi:hypothetical protein